MMASRSLRISSTVARARISTLPRPRAKDTRAEVIKQASGATYVHPAALFALTEAEIALHAETPRDYSWSPINPGEDAKDVDGDAGGGEGERDLSAEQERDAGPAGGELGPLTEQHARVRGRASRKAAECRAQAHASAGCER